MPSFGVFELVVAALLLFGALYPFWYFGTNQLAKDLRKIRQMWQGSDPNARRDD